MCRNEKQRNLVSLILILAMVLTMLVGFWAPVYAAEGTDGTEMQVLEAEQLEIQLGADWAGVEFELKTDAGMYPGTIAVGADGVLRMEIGGSKSYVLTCLNSSIAAPDPAQASATDEEQPKDGQTEMESAGQEAIVDADQEGPNTSHESGQPESGKDEIEENQANTIAGIPVVHLVVFGVGMALAVGCLIAMYVIRRRNGVETDDDDDVLDADYEEEED